LSAGRLTELTKASVLVGYFRCVEPPHSYVHETSSSVVHHRDYLNRRNDQALCGVAFEYPAPLSPTIRPVAVCPDCEAKLVEYHLRWWRERAEAATAELDGLRIKYRELAEYVDDQRRQVEDCSILRMSGEIRAARTLGVAVRMTESRRPARPLNKAKRRRHPSSTRPERNS
jgi:hypothetical protein